MSKFSRDGITIYHGDVLQLYALWERPTVIISDGAYGLNSFPGDPVSPELLADWYKPHVEAWSQYALPSTTLWFWNSELGWANVHPVLAANGWEYRNCHIWDKGIAHIAGNSNSKTLRKFPVTTEVCVQYVKKNYFYVNGGKVTMQEWLRYEWERTGLPFSKTNEACGVKNAATRKYFTQDHLWYFPPTEAFEALVQYAHLHGKVEGKPYFSMDNHSPLSSEEWSKMRAKFYCVNGTTNVWKEPAVRGTERLKDRNQCLHMNQKPLKLLELCITSSSDKNDTVWEPFGGLCSAIVAAHKVERIGYAAEVIERYYQIAIKRLEGYDAPEPQLGFAWK